MAYANGSNFKLIKDSKGAMSVQRPSGERVIDWAADGAPIYAFQTMPDGSKRRVCNARQAGTDLLCQKTATSHLGRCATHTNAVAKAHAQAYRGSTMAITLPSSLAADVERLATDPQYLSVKQDIHLLEVRLEQIYADLETAVGSDTWERLSVKARHLDRMMAEGLDGDNPFFRTICKDIVSIVQDGSKKSELWDEAMRVTGEKAKLQKQEMQFLITQSGMITREQAAALVTMLVRVVTDEIDIAVPEKIGAILKDNIAVRIAHFIGGAPARSAVTVIDGVPLEVVDPSKGDISGGRRHGKAYGGGYQEPIRSGLPIKGAAESTHV